MDITFTSPALVHMVRGWSEAGICHLPGDGGSGAISVSILGHPDAQQVIVSGGCHLRLKFLVSLMPLISGDIYGICQDGTGWTSFIVPEGPQTTHQIPAKKEPSYPLNFIAWFFRNRAEHLLQYKSVAMWSTMRSSIPLAINAEFTTTPHLVRETLHRAPHYHDTLTETPSTEYQVFC